jgi:hypothetical protein
MARPAGRLPRNKGGRRCNTNERALFEGRGRYSTGQIEELHLGTRGGRRRGKEKKRSPGVPC